MSTISPFAPEPVRFPVMLQSWEHLTFLHWGYDPDLILPHIPSELTVDTYDGKAWIGLTPFLLTHLRPPFTPAIPWISKFPEMNVRTYVQGADGKRAVWFFTLECDRALAVAAARLTYGLPYRWARMRVRPDGKFVRYASRRGQAFARATVKAGAPVLAGDFENFLTARYRLYTRVGGRLALADIEHDPWPLQDVYVRQLQQNVVEACGLPAPQGDPVAHYSRTLDVRIGTVRFV